MCAIMRQGPHQVAQKSTTVRPSAFSTCTSKSASVTAVAFDILPPQSPGEPSLGSAIGISIQRRHHLTSALSMSDVPRRAPRIAHVGIAVRALDEILPFYRDVLGLPQDPLDDADGARIAGLAAGESLVELLEGQSPDSPIGKFIAKKGPG